MFVFQPKKQHCERAIAYDCRPNPTHESGAIYRDGGDGRHEVAADTAAVDTTAVDTTAVDTAAVAADTTAATK